MTGKYIFVLLPCKSDAKQKIAKTREFFVREFCSRVLAPSPLAPYIYYIDLFHHVIYFVKPVHQYTAVVY